MPENERLEKLRLAAWNVKSRNEYMDGTAEEVSTQFIRISSAGFYPGND